MMRFLALFLTVCLLMLAKPVSLSFHQDVVLQKDELLQARVLVSHVQKPLSFRWTLYKQEGVVVVLHYDKIPYQFILYPDSSRHRFRLSLDHQNKPDLSEFFIVFKGFDSGRAHFQLLVYGDVGFTLMNLQE